MQGLGAGCAEPGTPGLRLPHGLGWSMVLSERTSAKETRVPRGPDCSPPSHQPRPAPPAAPLPELKPKQVRSLGHLGDSPHPPLRLGPSMAVGALHGRTLLCVRLLRHEVLCFPLDLISRDVLRDAQQMTPSSVTSRVRLCLEALNSF